MVGAVQVIRRDRNDQLGEGCLWSARECALYWTDITGQRLNRLDLATGSVASWAMPDHIGWVIERAQGGLVAGIGRAFVRLSLDPLTIEVIAAPEHDMDGNRFNDAKADALGRIWAGSMPIDCDVPSGALYRLDLDGVTTRVDAPYTIPNGPAITPDGTTLFHTDTALDTVFRFPIHDDGSLGQRVPHIVFDKGWGHPDGMTLDADGHLWIACWGAGCVTRFAPDGRRERSIALPASQVTNCTFAGDALDRMFVTSAADGVDEEAGGALFEIDPGVIGLSTATYTG